MIPINIYFGDIQSQGSKRVQPVSTCHGSNKHTLGMKYHKLTKMAAPRVWKVRRER